MREGKLTEVQHEKNNGSFCIYFFTDFCFGQSSALFDNFKLGDDQNAAVKLIAKKYPGFTKIDETTYQISLKDRTVKISFLDNAINDVSISYGKVSFSKYLKILNAMYIRFKEPVVSIVSKDSFTLRWYQKHPVNTDCVYDMGVTVKAGNDFIVDEFCFINR